LVEEPAKKKVARTWLMLATLVAIGSSAFVLWLTFLGSAYQETYRQFLTYMFAMVLALGIPSELSVSEPDRPKILIVTVASCFGTATAFFLPELHQSTLSYLFGNIAVIGFTVFLLFTALREMASSPSIGVFFYSLFVVSSFANFNSMRSYESEPARDHSWA